MKKGLIFVIISIFVLGSLLFLVRPKNSKNTDNSRIKIVATLYPQYDFAKKIGGDKVDVSLLLTPGTETHTYEPTPQDLISINESKLFIYTGKYMEPWADRIISSVDSKSTKVLDASKNISLIKSEDDDDEEEDENEKNEHEHDEHDEHKHEDHHHEFDPHIWLNPKNAIIMVKNITEELCAIDNENDAYYRKNSEELIKQIEELDGDFETVVNEASSRKIAFGGTFAYTYFINRYGLEYATAYDSCGESAEPSVAKVKEVIDYMKKNNIKVVFYQELSAGKIADSIAAETGAQKLVFNTAHNPSQEDYKNGVSYIELMRRNLENLKIALN